MRFPQRSQTFSLTRARDSAYAAPTSSSAPKPRNPTGKVEHDARTSAFRVSWSGRRLRGGGAFTVRIHAAESDGEGRAGGVRPLHVRSRLAEASPRRAGRGEAC